MFLVDQAKWSLGAASCSFEQRQVLDRLASQLTLVYGKPDCEPLPERLKDLVAKLGAASTGTVEDDLSQSTPPGTPPDPPGP